MEQNKNALLQAIGKARLFEFGWWESNPFNHKSKNLALSTISTYPFGFYLVLPYLALSHMPCSISFAPK